jgi:sulfoxide reductase catalytic subunit YedY
MANIILRPDWFIPENAATPEKIYRNRRQFLREMGIAGIGVLAPSLVARAVETSNSSNAKLYPAKRNPEFNPDWKLTDEKIAGSYNNFYEFSLGKEKVKDLVGNFVISPWSVKVGGLVEKPQALDLDDIVKTAALEERVYKFRCVEGWSMTVPWTGFPLSKLIERLKPKTEAKFIRFETANLPEQMPGMRFMKNYPWPYFEGLRMDEAMNPLTMVVTGIYGKALAKQHGAPIRIVVPWKYGYKSIKSIVKIDFITTQPTTFWETLAPDEYPFESNVNPSVPHPRWSQATERIIDSGDRAKTQIYNGYGKYVAALYKK